MAYSNVTSLAPGLRIIGPADATVAKVNDLYRKVIYLKHEAYDVLVAIKDKVEQFAVSAEKQQISIAFDFNPMNGM